MPNQFTPAQMELIDALWEEQGPFLKNGNINKRMILSVVTRCPRVGPREGLSVQTIGALYANRFAVQEGRPRAMQKTLQQLEMLRELWEKGLCPHPGETILVTHDSASLS